MDMPINATIPAREDNFSRMIVSKKLLDGSALINLQTQAALFQQSVFQHVMQYQCIDATALQIACAEYFDIPMIDIQQNAENQTSQPLIPDHVIKNHFLLPILTQENKLVIAISNPNDIDTAKNLSFQLNKPVDITFARYDTLCRLHNVFLNTLYYEIKKNSHETSIESIAKHIFSDAIHRNASDIHIEPYQKKCRIRFRIDGLLNTILELSHEHSDALISCIKIFSQLDIAIKRIPQDGRLTFRSHLGFVKDCRVSTCPTHHGEKIVIRLLDANSQIKPIEELGLHRNDQTIILRTIQQPQGLILVTGPTGSGKTITLYTLLNLLNKEHRNVITIEDPIEIQMEGINQTHVNVKTGLTFSNALRTLLRQDPDVIMIGEIRDQETAEMAIRAAQTGHLVLSTLHTNNAAEAVTRLHHMGVAPFHLASALSLVIAQRLVRYLCTHCKTPDILSKSVLFNAGFTEPFFERAVAYQPNGCSQCTNGFHGRFGVFEIMPITATLKQLLLDHAPHASLAQHNAHNKHLDLWQSGLHAVTQGYTSLDEIYRVIPKGNHLNETRH